MVVVCWWEVVIGGDGLRMKKKSVTERRERC
jgi:hypothetical protein